MSNNYAFPAAQTVAVPVEGSEQLFPVNRIFCVGRNYLAHAAEMGVAVDKSSQEPFYFMKNASAYLSSGSSIDYPPQTDNYHYEMELVVAIGQAGFELSEEETDKMIFGYACGLDMTRRDLQLKARETGRPWDMGKNFEQSAVLAPIVPVAKTGLLNAGSIELSVDGQTKQSSDLNCLIWNVREIIAHLSKFYHLQAGDLIYTGTPEGVGPVLRGNTISGSIAGVGAIELNINA